jgi:hypothetical protein
MAEQHWCSWCGENLLPGAISSYCTVECAVEGGEPDAGPREFVPTKEPLEKMPPVEFPSPHHCVFPVGHLGRAGFHFCAALTVLAYPYCDKHMKLCYVKAPPSKKKMVLKQVGTMGYSR